MARITPQQWKAFAIVAAGWLFVLLYAWPGIMTNDCYDQLREGRAGFYTDAHPPVMSVLWRYLDKLVAGPAALYVLQTTGLFAGLYLFFRRLYPPVRAATIAICVVLYPPVLAPMSVVWKDALMATCLVLGIAGLATRRRNPQLAGLAALWLASAVRYNAPAATLVPILLLFEWKPARWYVRYPLAFAAWVAITGSSMAVNKALTDQPMYFWTSSTAIHDIAGTLAYVDDDIPDAELRALFAGTQIRVDTNIHATIRAHYSRDTFVPLVLGDKALWDLPIMGHTPAPAAQRDAVDRAWRELVTSYPGAYLAHRLDVFIGVLGIPDKRGGIQVEVGRRQNRLFAVPMGLDYRSHLIQNRLQLQVERVANYTPLFRAWLYALAALVVLVLGRRNRLVLALLGSGLMLEASLLPFAPSPDFRYSHWLVICTVLAAVVVVHDRRAKPCASPQ